ncbi:hypothetical protein [Prevotella sp. E2-28]|uniref:hypothetical protein n=1 Tax=Prevotella sp. E2-28 TaxID=2913620 RepID=UPI001EDC06AE|nr:hypothetical protein [Prevotella sp. E2-28]UKK52682.1 hypothetical protein L6465_08700 [Prevotella sp. E2-28]
MGEIKKMEFGKKYQVGNFVVFKINKVLRKSEVRELRANMNIPTSEREKLKRAQLPYIKVEANSGIWAIEFCCNTQVYHMIDQLLGDGSETHINTLHHVFNMWFMDTTVAGDAEYQEAKAVALKSFMGRVQAKPISDEEDKKILDEMENDENQKAAIIEMAKHAEGEEGNNEG